MIVATVALPLWQTRESTEEKGVTQSQDRMITRSVGALALSVICISGCSTVAEPPKAPAAETPRAAAVVPAVSVNALMVAWIDHSGHELWDVEQAGKAPKSDADWRNVERHATQLAASGTLVALGGTGQADPGWAQSPDWRKHSQDLTDAGLAALDAAHKKDFEALVKANGQLVDACENCHKEFKPALPTEGKSHQPH